MLKRMKCLFLILVLGVSPLLPGCGAKSEENALVGTWVLDYGEDLPVDRNYFQYFTEGANTYLHSVSFFEDGTYAAEIRFIFDWDLEPGNLQGGRYDVVHDGTSISFDEIAYYPFEFKNGDLSIKDENDHTFLYHRSETLGETEGFRVTEINGMPVTDYIGAEMFLILQRDHRVIFYTVTYDENRDMDGDIDSDFLYITWERTEDGLVLSDNETGEIYLVGTYQGDTLMFEEDGQSVVFTRMDLNELR